MGLSGGPDSLCLFDVLKEMNVDITAVHVDHKLREQSGEDARKVKELCDGYGVPCRIFEYDCATIAKERGMSAEEAGRMVRYEAFDAVCEEIGGGVIAVAQNMDDQAETVLFRMIRGTGPDGLAAIRYVRKSRKGYDIVRPLLDVPRIEIEEYLKDRGLEPLEDKTNSQTVYTRNRIRLELIPYIEKNFGRDIKGGLARLAGLLAVDSDYLDGEAEEALERIRKGRGISYAGLCALPGALKGRAIIKLMKEAGLEEDVSYGHIKAVEELSHGSLNLPGGYRCISRYDELCIVREEEINVIEGRKLKAVFDKQALEEAFGTSKIEVRTRRPGDYIRLKPGRKKIKDLFIDMKVPAEKRENIKLAVIGHEVLWAAGLRYSDMYKVTEDTAETVELVIEI